ncbi:hypothetical protein HN446_02775 [bacterium]|jgi:phosphatidylglycerol---prolipoprotein diacylglyceryl transferase|nr:hypothetical protein [bacterium]
MYPKILHIWGPLYINSFGAMIAFGLFITMWFISKDKRRTKIISLEDFSTVLVVGVVTVVSGARILTLITEHEKIHSIVDLFDFWNGGISSLGGIIAALIVIPIYLHYKKIKFLSFFDLIATYLPIVHIFTRIGCFLAGCCYGTKSNLSWAIQYTNPQCEAPLHVHIHPTQIYSILALILVFIVILVGKKYLFTKTGQIAMLYLFMTGLERFSVDFWRGDRSFFKIFSILSIDQICALAVTIVGLCGFLYLTFLRKECKTT